MRHLILRTEQVCSVRYVAPPGLSLSLGLLTHSLRCGLLISHPLRGFFLCVGKLPRLSIATPILLSPP
jgi:hypothetical protein